jgi:hypothetical protein
VSGIDGETGQREIGLEVGRVGTDCTRIGSVPKEGYVELDDGSRSGSTDCGWLNALDVGGSFVGKFLESYGLCNIIDGGKDSSFELRLAALEGCSSERSDHSNRRYSFDFSEKVYERGPSIASSS